jgi:hypothetical protein
VSDLLLAIAQAEPAVSLAPLSDRIQVTAAHVGPASGRQTKRA